MSVVWRSGRLFRQCCRRIGLASVAFQTGRITTSIPLRRRLHTAQKDATKKEEQVVEETKQSSFTISSPPLVYPPQPRSVKHHDLASFLHSAERSGLDPASTTYVGTHYEYAIAARLVPLGFDLRRVGGSSDRGIDLLGTWTIPSSEWSADHAPIRVLLQCKAGAGQRIGPNLVRELEGAFVGAPAGWQSRPGDGGVSATGYAVIGLLVAEKPATKGIRSALIRSRWPMVFVCCSGTGHLQQMIWNKRAEEEGGLDSLGVAIRYTENAEDSGLVLTWQGRPITAASTETNAASAKD